MSQPRTPKSKRSRKARKSVLHHVSGHVLSAAGLTALSVFIVGSFAFTAIVAGPGLRSAQLAAVVTATLVDLTNQDRAQNQLDGLTVNPLLTEAAQAKANDMATNSYFAHVSPTGLTSWYWFQKAGYSFSYAGENLAVDFTDSDTVNQAWMNSPEHRANILNSHFTDIGIAEAQGMYEGQETTFIVQDFGAPATDAAEADDDVVASISPAIPTDMAYATTKVATSSDDVLGASVAPTQTAPQAPSSHVSPTTPTSTHSIVAANSAFATSTRTQAAAASSAAAPQYAPSWALIVASPELLLRIVYFLCGAILLIALIVRTRFEFKRHHMRHVAAVLVLLAVMAALLFVTDHYIFVQPVLGSAATASI